MKRNRTLPFALAAALCLALAACAAPAPAPTPEPTPAPAVENTPVLAAEPPIPDWLKDEPAPEFLDEEQQALFVHARAAAGFLMGCSTTVVDEFPLADGSAPDNSGWETVEPDFNVFGWNYLVSHGRYRRWEEFQAMMDGLFTKEYQQELLNVELEDGTQLPRFTSTEDGLLCYVEADRGSILEYDWCDTPDSYEPVSQTEDEIVFHLIGHYAVLEFGEDYMPNPVGETTQAYPIRMERTQDGWRVAEFHVPY